MVALQLLLLNIVEIIDVLILEKFVKVHAGLYPYIVHELVVFVNVMSVA